jgi:hypothetical protein
MSEVGVIVVVVDEPPVREQLAADLSRRFEPDYRIVGRSSQDAAMLLEALAGREPAVAAVVAGAELPSAATSGVELLARREGRASSVGCSYTSGHDGG